MRRWSKKPPILLSMKYKAKEYAKAIAQIEKFDARKFFQLLLKNGDLKKAKEIVRLAEKFILAKSGNKKVVLETARKTGSQEIAKKIIAKGDIVEEKINPALVAGVRVIINDERQLDFSLQKKLQQI